MFSLAAVGGFSERRCPFDCPMRSLLGVGGIPPNASIFGGRFCLDDGGEQLGIGSFIANRHDQRMILNPPSWRLFACSRGSHRRRGVGRLVPVTRGEQQHCRCRHQDGRAIVHRCRHDDQLDILSRRCPFIGRISLGNGWWRYAIFLGPEHLGLRDQVRRQCATGQRGDLIHRNFLVIEWLSR